MQQLPQLAQHAPRAPAVALPLTSKMFLPCSMHGAIVHVHACVRDCLPCPRAHTQQAPKHFPVQGVVYTPTPTHHPALSRTQLTEYMPALQAAADACDASTVHAPPLKGPCPLVVSTS